MVINKQQILTLDNKLTIRKGVYVYTRILYIVRDSIDKTTTET